MLFVEELRNKTKEAREDRIFDTKLTDRFMDVFKKQCLEEATKGNRTAQMKYCEEKENNQEIVFFFEQVPQYKTYNIEKYGFIKCVEKSDYPIEKIKAILERQLKNEGFVNLSVKTIVTPFVYTKYCWKRRVKAEAIEVIVHW